MISVRSTIIQNNFSIKFQINLNNNAESVETKENETKEAEEV